MFVTMRIFVGLILAVSGFEKLIGPYQNFLFVVQSYEFLPNILELAVARGLPWVEFLIGLFLILGLWLSWIIPLALILFGLFVGVVGQALMRGLPITECGCFGGLITFPLYVTLVIDVLVFCLLGLIMKKTERVRELSLDKYFNNGEHL